MTAHTVHIFESTGEAYDASQCDDRIKDGDILIATGERVAGILVKAWPVAITMESGAFHRFLPDASNEYRAQIKSIENVIAKRGWPLDPTLSEDN